MNEKQALACTKKLNTYLDEIPLRDAQIDRVVFYDTTIQLGMFAELEEALSPDISQEILWELCHMSFCFKLLSLNGVATNMMYHAHGKIMQAEASVAHIQEVLHVFPMSGKVVGSFMINEIPNHDLGLTSPDLVERNCHWTALRHLMCSWKGCLDFIKNATYGPLVTQVQLLEEACAKFYCQSFFDNFGCAPVIPCHLPS